jgi:uncharacterized membrane protein
MCCVPSNKKQHVSNTQTSSLSPIDLLKIRLARGEITFEEYEKIKAELVK